MSANIENIVKGSFRLLNVAPSTEPFDPVAIFNRLADERNAFDPVQAKSGFERAKLSDGFVSVNYRLVSAESMVILRNGKFEKFDFNTVETCSMAFNRTFAVIQGNSDAIKMGRFELAKSAGVGFAEIHLAPVRVYKLSESMSMIRAVAMKKLKRGNVSGATFSGKFESMSEIEPFASSENTKSIKGTVETCDGLRTIAINSDAKVSIGLTREEKADGIDSRILAWVFNFVTAGR